MDYNKASKRRRINDDRIIFISCPFNQPRKCVLSQQFRRIRRHRARENDVKIWQIGMIQNIPQQFLSCQVLRQTVNLLPESEAGYQHGFTDIGINK